MDDPVNGENASRNFRIPGLCLVNGELIGRSTGKRNLEFNKMDNRFLGSRDNGVADNRSGIKAGKVVTTCVAISSD